MTTPVTGAEFGPATWTMTSTAAAATYSAALETIAAGSALPGIEL